jgi:hypothetical protein
MVSVLDWFKIRLDQNQIGLELDRLGIRKI